MRATPVRIFWTTFEHNDWKLYLAATESGLLYMTLPNEDFATLELWMQKYISKPVLVQEQVTMEPYLLELEEYFRGQRTHFSIPLDLRGTHFQVQIWRALLQIPFGETRTYSQVAQSVGRPTAMRAVGAANRANPIPVIVPCHRVIGKNGTLVGYRGGLSVKTRLLELESVQPALGGNGL